jgi:nucleotide-binding universal stress UspA family protein
MRARKPDSSTKSGSPGLFEKIILPIDLSNRHTEAVATAAKLVDRPNGVVVLLHVIETMVGLSLEEEKDFYDRLKRTARKHVAKLARALTERKVRCRAEILCGHRVQEIVRHAEAAGADLIVLTGRRVDADDLASGWGSLSFKVSVLATCPVLLVK